MFVDKICNIYLASVRDSEVYKIPAATSSLVHVVCTYSMNPG